MANQCSTCFFCRTDGAGVLRCHAAIPQAAPGIHVPGGADVPATWTEVKATDWCGAGALASTGASFSQGVTGLPENVTVTNNVTNNVIAGQAVKYGTLGAPLPTLNVNLGDWFIIGSSPDEINIWNMVLDGDPPLTPMWVLIKTIPSL